MAQQTIVIDKTELSQQWAARYGAKQIAIKRLIPTTDDLSTNLGTLASGMEHDEWLDYQDDLTARTRRAQLIEAYSLKIEMPEIRPSNGKWISLNDYAVAPAYYESIAVDEIGKALSGNNAAFLASQRGQRLQDILKTAGYQF